MEQSDPYLAAKMLSSRIELETLAVLKPCDNQLHHESQLDDNYNKTEI